MLSVIIPTEGVERTAVATLAALVPGAAAGVVSSWYGHLMSCPGVTSGHPVRAAASGMTSGHWSGWG